MPSSNSGFIATLRLFSFWIRILLIKLAREHLGLQVSLLHLRVKVAPHIIQFMVHAYDILHFFSCCSLDCTIGAGYSKDTRGLYNLGIYRIHYTFLHILYTWVHLRASLYRTARISLCSSFLSQKY